jgi:hypothetical protein
MLGVAKHLNLMLGVHNYVHFTGCQVLTRSESELGVILYILIDYGVHMSASSVIKLLKCSVRFSFVCLVHCYLYFCLYY